ncbi:MAG: hypothetical protein NTW96_21040 [Planctomycetia bacterium]|nr:hypothetical protein [Planctomycetia bacterium]
MVRRPGVAATSRFVPRELAAPSSRTLTAPLDSTLRLGPETYTFDAPAPVIADARGNYPVPMPGITKAL